MTSGTVEAFPGTRGRISEKTGGLAKFLARHVQCNITAKPGTETGNRSSTLIPRYCRVPSHKTNFPASPGGNHLKLASYPTKRCRFQAG
jgi:hypothetical protein